MSGLPLFCLDTHTLYWHRLDSSKLSARATQAIDDGIQGKAVLVISFIVIAELFYVLQKYRQPSLFAPLLAEIQSCPYYRIEPVEFSDLLAFDSMPEISEMHDRLIALAAKRLGATIVTKDKSIQASPQITWLW